MIVKRLVQIWVLCLVGSILLGCQMLRGSQVVLVSPAYGVLEELFQTEVIAIGLEELGYQVAQGPEIEYDIIHTSIANGYLDLTPSHWHPLHTDYYEDNGGSQVMERVGDLIANAMQGYLIDRDSAQQQQITSIQQLQDPTLARLFDIDGNGKADLIGCNPGWGCAQIIDHHLQAYGLEATVEHRQGNYSTLIAETIDRFQQGQPILYYTYTPLWVSGVLQPGQEVEWLQVPFSSLPDRPQGTVDTRSASGLDTGFPLNQIQILANRDFLEENPRIERFCEQVQIPIEDVSAQNLQMRQGENQPEDIHRHAQAWIDSHRAEFDRWLMEARGIES